MPIYSQNCWKFVSGLHGEVSLELSVVICRWACFWVASSSFHFSQRSPRTSDVEHFLTKNHPWQWLHSEDFLLFIFIILSKAPHQPGYWTHDPKIKTHMLYLTEPARCPGFFFFFFFLIFIKCKLQEAIWKDYPHLFFMVTSMGLDPSIFLALQSCV